MACVNWGFPTIVSEYEAFQNTDSIGITSTFLFTVVSIFTTNENIDTRYGKQFNTEFTKKQWLYPQEYN